MGQRTAEEGGGESCWTHRRGDARGCVGEWRVRSFFYARHTAHCEPNVVKTLWPLDEVFKFFNIPQKVNRDPDCSVESVGTYQQILRV
jgi:hypothetical protein